MKAVFLILTLFPALSCMAQEWNLDKCLSYAMENNKNLLSGQYSTNIQRIERKSVQSRLFPELSANANLDYYWKLPVQTLPGELVGQSAGTFITVPTTTTYAGSYGLNLTLNLVNPEIWSQIKLEMLREQEKQYEYASMEKLLSRNVSISYYLVQQYENDRNTAAQQYNNQKQLHELIGKLLNEGLLDQIAYNQSLTMLKNKEEIHINACHVLESGFMDLKFWMGYPVDSILTIQKKSYLPAPEIPEFESSLLPDYDIQRLKTDIAERKYKTSLSAFYPKLELVGNYGQLGFGENRNLITKTSAWHTSSFIGIRLSIPLFSFSNTQTARKGKVMLEQSKVDFSHYEESQRKTYIQQAINLRNGWDILNIQEEKLHLAQENERLSMQRIESGIIDMFQLKQIQQDLIDEQNKYNQAKTNYLKHYVEVIYLQSR